ncbi:MAG: hypothetical protein ABSD21_05435 [Rhizomicrobium sp.]|jgi:hypothetical protein
MEASLSNETPAGLFDARLQFFEQRNDFLLEVKVKIVGISGNTL